MCESFPPTVLYTVGVILRRPVRKNKKLPSLIGTRVYSRVATQLAFRPSSVAVSGEPVKFIICRSGAERLVTLPTCTDRRLSEKVSDLLLPLCVSFITCFKVYELSGTVSRKYIIDRYCIRQLKTNIFVIYTFSVFLCILYLSYSSFLVTEVSHGLYITRLTLCLQRSRAVH